MPDKKHQKIGCIVECGLSNERFCFKQEQEVRDWIEAVLEEPLPAGDYEEVCVPFRFIKKDIC